MLKPLFPNIKVVWGVRASNVDFSRYDWFPRFTFAMSCRLARFADLIIVNSKAGRDYHQALGYPGHKMVVIPNGIDTDKFYPDPGERRRVRAEWGIAEQERLIGLVARFDPMKDHHTFLKAAAMLAQEREDVRFVCVGDGPAEYRQELHAYARQLDLTGRLIWAGARRDMPGVYNALDIATSSSLGEGFSNVIGEAMACGAPCVVTDVGDSAWLVGETGVVVSPTNPQALAAGWRACLERDMSLLSGQARLRVVENFSIKLLVERMEKALWQSA
jgi:glycosyltransferase involved in cell wall biosynthesis